MRVCVTGSAVSAQYHLYTIIVYNTFLG